MATGYRYLVILIMVVVLTSRLCAGFDDGDFQYWSSATAKFDINKQWYGTVEEEFRIGDDAKRLYYRHTDLGVATNLADWLTLGFNFRHIAERGTGRDWKWENRPHLNLTFKAKLAGFALSDRSRFEYRDKYDAKDMWRYRNKFIVVFPWELTPLGLKPYIAEEFYLDLDRSGISRNRFYSGVSMKLSDNLSGNIYYLWQASKSAYCWNDLHILGTQIKCVF
ncbi:MAG TPA: DUF2490 domain-containing protein [Planctomycetes bacterium]|nr:DUF2490 domain-containing protein [Planctomycetota bacterium]